ncbi:Lecithin--cholesterol acyltransferase [Methylorubrum aminovorans]
MAGRRITRSGGMSSGKDTVVGGFGDIIVMLPGVIGSVLSKDGEPLWGTSPGALWGLVAGKNLERLTLAGADNGEDELGDGIVATAPVPNVEIIPGLWKQGGYSRLATDLVTRLELTRGENFFEFPYDWRRDNRVSARKLARVAPGWLANWKERSGNGNAKIVLVAHSMGGLVGRYFMECLEGWKIVRTMVSFGTPYRGSGNAVDFLCNGFVWKVGAVPAFDGTDALRSFDSIYQLLPIYPFVEQGGTALVRLTEVSHRHLDGARVLGARAFHDEMAAARASNARDPAYAAAGSGIRPVVGVNQPTWQSAVLKDGLMTTLRTHEGKELGGDGTVSRVSAIPIEDGETSATYFATTHSALQSVPAALEHLKGVMTGAAIDLRRFRSDQGVGAPIRLAIRDAYPVDEPFVLEAVPSTYRQTLNGTVERLDEPAETRDFVLRPRGDVHRAEASLPPGLYRASVHGQGLAPVSDVFLVLDPSGQA